MYPKSGTTIIVSYDFLPFFWQVKDSATKEAFAREDYTGIQPVLSILGRLEALIGKVMAINNSWVAFYLRSTLGEVGRPTKALLGSS